MSAEIHTDIVVDDNIEKLLTEVAQEEGIYGYKIVKSNSSTFEKINGYTGVITDIELVGKDRKNKDVILKLIIKSASKNDTLRLKAPLVALLEREIYMYSTALSTFRIFEVEKGLAPSYFGPKFYKGCMENKSEVLILENLKTSGYHFHSRKVGMDKDHVRLIMTEYGRLHALSFALRDQNPEFFGTIKKSMNDLSSKFLNETNFKNAIIQRCVKAQEVLNPDVDVEATKSYGAFTNSIHQFYNELPDSLDDYSVVLHGDCWENSMMFKYDGNNTPRTVRFIEFQNSRIGSPVLDIACFFYACGSKQTINKLSYYLQLYHNSLSTYLRKLGSNSEELFPYSVLQQHWKKYARYGLMLSSLVIHVMLTEKEETTDLSDVVDSGNYNVLEYNKRIRDIILHFVENRFI